MSFEEKQQLNLWWLYILIGIEVIIVGSLILFDKNGFSIQQLRDIYFAPLWIILLPFAIIFLVNKSTFSIKIDKDGIRYHYWPFERRKFISWDVVNEAFLRKYDALGEYGGWGVKHRLWFKLKDKAYIFNEQTVGLQLLLANGKRLLFSTSKKEELNLFLINLKQKYQIGAIDTDVRER